MPASDAPATVERLDDPPRLRLATAPGGEAEVHLHGAHVTRWRDAARRDVLYLSPLASFTPGASIRGGIPVVFPQFADLGPLPKHGFARTAQWAVGSTRAGEAAEVVLVLEDDEATRALWPHRFQAELTVHLGEVLRVTLSVTNRGDAPFECTAALHSYLRVADATSVAIDGLDGRRYLDKVQGGDHLQAGPLRVVGEVDRVYREVASPLRLRGGVDDPALRLQHGGFPDAVVWNPGPEKGPEIADLGGDEWRRFVCVEAAAVAQPLRLEPGERWSGWQLLVPTPDRA